ncbi:MAG: glycosyltransferase family 2 protein [Halocynthiibacter sp.]
MTTQTEISSSTGLKKRISPHGSLVALSTMKDEGPYIVEWVAHHLALGFTEIMVYTNDCSDGTDLILKRLEALNIGVHHRENIIPEGMKPHPSMLKASAKEDLIINSDWLLVLDADEFMSINHPSGTLDGLVGDLNTMGADAMVITWRIFGSSNIRDWSRAPITEQFTWAAPQFWNKGWGTKTMLRFDPKYLRLGMHRPIIKSQHRETDYPDSVLWVNGSGRPTEDWFKIRGWRSIRRTLGYDWAQMNHYAIKSMDAFSLRKYRGNANLKKDKYNDQYWALQDRNEVQDFSIQRHQEAMKEVMQKLLSDPEVARLHDAAHSHAENVLAGYKKQDAYQEYVAQLVEAGKIPISEVVAKPPKARDPAKIAAVQAKIEKRRNALPKGERRTPAPVGWGAPGVSPYVLGSIDLSNDIALEVVENQGIKLKVDPRVYTPLALEAIQNGKFERQHARKIGGLTSDCQRLLNICAGMGFVGLKAGLSNPTLHIMNHDDRSILVELGRAIRNEQFPDEKHRIQYTEQPLRAPDCTENHYTGLMDLIRKFRPDALRLPPDALKAEGFAADAPGSVALQSLKLIIFPFLDPMQIDQTRKDYSEILTAHGFSEDPDAVYSGSVCYRKSAQTTGTV